ncbi:hypothetical protein [Spirochaeta dissipatitropha]
MKKTESRLAIFTALVSGIILLSAYVVSCDTFSLREEFSPVDTADNYPSLTLRADVSELQQNSSAELFPEGGKPPYSFRSIADDLVHINDETAAGSIQPHGSGFHYHTGKSIGRVEVELRDSLENRVKIDLLIIPEQPVITAQGNFPSGPPAPSGVRITWINEEGADSVQIERRENDQNSEWIKIRTEEIAESTTGSFLDGDAEETGSYLYRVRVIAGPYESPWSEEAAYP